LRRGDVVTVVFPGDYGKPRPAVVVQADSLTEAGLESVLLCPMTSQVSGRRTFRVPVAPTPGNGLAQPSEIMVEKLAGVARKRVRDPIGRLDAAGMQALERALLLVLGFA
jgi:mRNA interferase MazF